VIEDTRINVAVVVDVVLDGNVNVNGTPVGLASDPDSVYPLSSGLARSNTPPCMRYWHTDDWKG
jgi:hypothetical protein